MKRKILIFAAALFVATGVKAQFTTSNAPVVGDNVTLFVVDSLAATYDDIVGDDVVWDYSELNGYNGIQKSVSVLSVDDTDYDTTFVDSDHAIIIEDYLISYYGEITSERMSKGFVFLNVDPELEELDNIVVPFNIKEAKVFDYPFNFGDVIEDDYSGAASVVVDLGTILHLEPEMEGELKAEVDGIGKLLLGGNEYDNVYRYKITETAEATVAELGGETANLNRTQYEYYDFTVSNLPIFIRSTLTFSLGGMDLIDVNLALSSVNPETVGVEKNQLTTIEVYPNPTTDILNINTKEDIGNIDLEIIDELGRVVYSTVFNSSVKTIDVSSLNTGVYFVKMNNANNTITKKIIIE